MAILLEFENNLTEIVKNNKIHILKEKKMDKTGIILDFLKEICYDYCIILKRAFAGTSAECIRGGFI